MKAFLGLRFKTHSGTAILLTAILGFAALSSGALSSSESLAAAPVQAAPASQKVPATAGVSVQVTVTEEPHHNAAVPPLQMSDVTVTEGRNHDQIDSLIAAQGPQAAGLQLLVLIDDSDHWTISDQFNELRNFILEQPPTTAIGIGYMYNGLVEMDQAFTSDHNAVLKALRPPLGRAIGGSVYFSLTDMYKNKQWRPSSQYPRRAILLFTDGHDPYQRPYYTDTFVSEAIAETQAAGIQVFSICTPDSRNGGFAGGDLLLELSQATGGDNLYAGLLGAPFFKPFLADLNTLLQHQYLLRFEAHTRERRGSLQEVKIKTDVHDLTLLAPTAIYVPGRED